MNTSIFFDINHLAERTPWAHGILQALAGTVGLVVLVALLVAGLARAGWRRGSSARLAAGSLVAVLVAVGIGEAVAHVVSRPRPFTALGAVEVLGSRPGGSPLPDLHATLAAAVVVVLLVLGELALGALAGLAALLVAFAGIYVGTHFPTDALAGLVLGGLVATFAIPLVHRRAGGPELGRVPSSLSGELAALARPIAGAGPAAHPVPIAASGSVRLLEPATGGSGAGALPRPLRAAGEGAQPAPERALPHPAVTVIPKPPVGPAEEPGEA